jgi:hypothetical protein
MQKWFAVIVLGLLTAVGCGGQVPPAGHQANLSWTVPPPSGSWAGCVTGQVSCLFIISRIAVASGATSCPAPQINTSGVGNYTPLNQSNPATGTTYADISAAGGTWCWVGQTVQGAAISAPSNTTGPLTVLGNPTPPAMGTGTVANNEVLPVPVKTAQTKTYQVSYNLPVPKLHLEVIAR